MSPVLGLSHSMLRALRADFDTAADLDAALASSAGQRTRADIGNFASGGVTILHLADVG